MSQLALDQPEHPELRAAADGPHLLLLDQVTPEDRWQESPLNTQLPPPFPLIHDGGDQRTLVGTLGPFQVALDRPPKILVIQGGGIRVELSTDYDAGLMRVFQLSSNCPA